MINGSRKLPTRHITVRVPWHDNEWNGNVCDQPKCNTSCLILKRIGESKDQDKEQKIKGRSIAELKESERPPCQHEKVFFMSDTPMTRTVKHAYQDSADTHAHYLPTQFHHWKKSAACTPYSWVMKSFVEGNENSEGIADKLDLGYNSDNEPNNMNFETIWVQARENQLILLDTFFGALTEEKSLFIPYAKRTPLSESNKRVIVGIGKVLKVDKSVEYKYKTENPSLRSTIWERNVSHTITENYENGFLFPYKMILEEAKKDPSINPEDYVAFAPDEQFGSFSMGSEHLDSNGAIATLLLAVKAMEKIKSRFPGPWDKIINWLNGELNRIWKLRGAFPGLGSALTAFGLSEGTLISYEIEKLMASEENSLLIDPWNIFEKALNDKHILNIEIPDTLRKAWGKLKKEDKDLLILLSRFGINDEQATRIFRPSERLADFTSKEILENPYRIFEIDRHQSDSIGIHEIEMGMYPEKIVEKNFPLKAPSKMDGGLDPRRIRAHVIKALEKAAEEGSTIQLSEWVEKAINDYTLVCPCPVGPGTIDLAEEIFGNEIEIIYGKNKEKCYQLGRLLKCKNMISSVINGRIKGKRHATNLNWRKLIDDEFGPVLKEDRESENKARTEKARALQELYESRFSVLLGSAGVGKTTLLKMLCNLPEFKKEKFLLLAPTGKARVRLSSQTGIKDAQTLAQFLSFFERYDGETRKYLINDSVNRPEGYTNLIIDECSMLTEEQLGSCFDAIKGLKIQRIILVGDHRQLPPIGAGRPFLDIIKYLVGEIELDRKFPKVINGYAELSIGRRQTGDNREDVLLAKFFAGDVPDAKVDEMALNCSGLNSKYLKLVEWNGEEDLEKKLIQEIVSELKLKDENDEVGFEESIGGSLFNGRVYFWNHSGDRKGAASCAEDWQILSPVRPGGAGVEFINRSIQDRFRKTVWSWINTDPYYNRKIPKPMGPQRILYGDKVINVKNQKKQDYEVYPKIQNKHERYVANGDIGVVVGKYKGKNDKGLPKHLEIEFNAQRGHKYTFHSKLFGEDGQNPIELAYALTIHKSQGSQFGITFIILPNPCWLLSRELIYTSLTRQQNKLIVLHEGSWNEFLKYSKESYSTISTRFTNLFQEVSPVQISSPKGKVYMEKNLIHLTEKGELVRSKSEVIVANLLYNSSLKDYIYEAIVTGSDGKIRIPDFTIEDNNSGKTVIWEHLGLMSDEGYKQSWDNKLKWYREQGIFPLESGGGENGALITSLDGKMGEIDSVDIKAKIELAKKYLNMN